MSTLTRIFLNPHSRGGRKLLTQPQAMHAAVRACFPTPLDESTGRVLWRVDSKGGQHTLFIVGPEAPSTDRLVHQAGWIENPAQVADYRPFLNSLSDGQHWAFRLTANPVYSLPPNGSKRGKIVPCTSEPRQREWLREKSTNIGFEFPTVGPDSNPDATGLEPLTVSRRTDLSFSKGGERSRGRHGVTLRTAQFDGVLQITDADALRHALLFGIGRAKAYGCGLMTLAKVRN